MIVNVTETHINLGTRNDCRNCPITLAVNDLYKEHRYQIKTGSKFLSVANRDGMHIYSYLLPAIAQYFVDDFDSERIVCPISFEMPDIKDYTETKQCYSQQ
jgi:hypothetical protein